MKSWPLKKIEIALAVFILLFSIGLRINAPTADLPAHITFSGSTLTDEGNQCHNSRSKALYGEWYPDDWRISNYNPILPWIKYAIFKVCGVGMLQMRLVSYLFAALSLLFFFLTLKSYLHHNFKFVLLGTFLLGINFLYVMYNKIGTFETSIIFWLILTLYFLEKYRRQQKPIFLLLAGASTFMTFIFKSIMAYILPLPFAAYILMHLLATGEKRISLKKGLQNILFIIIGILILLIPWYLFHYLPNREWIISAPGQYMGKLMFPRSLEVAFRNFLTFPWKGQFYKIPIVWLSAILFVPLFFRRLLRKQAKLTEIGYVLFFFAHTVVFFIMSYRPTRYFIPVIPAMVFMTVVLFEHGSRLPQQEQESAVYRPSGKILLFTVDTLWLALAAYFCLIPLFSRYILSVSLPSLSVFYVIVCAAVIGAIYLLKHLYHKLSWKPGTGNDKLKYVFTSLIVLMIGISFVINMGYYLQWNANKTYTIRNMSGELGEKLENAYIGGMTSTVAVLENRHKALWLYPNFVNWDKSTFEKYPLTHALLGTDVSHEIIHFFNQWPERMARARLLKVYSIKDYFLHLYSFVEPYITDCRREDTLNYRVTVINPTKETIKNVRVGEVCRFERRGSREEREETRREITLKVFKGKERSSLAPGKNTIVISMKEQDVSSLLFFLDYRHSFSREVLRYEGENFPHKTGFNKKISDASNGYARYFDRSINGPGFLSYGPAVPYARGIIIAEFKLKFMNLKTKIRPLCHLDIYSYEDNGPIAEKTLRPVDIKKNEKGIYQISTVITATKTLEFRIQTEQWSDIAFDYIDITYYQGFFINIK